MTLNYPHESSVVLKANAVVGGSIPGREIVTLPDEKLCCGKKIPHVCQKRKKKKVNFSPRRNDMNFGENIIPILTKAYFSTNHSFKKSKKNSKGVKHSSVEFKAFHGQWQYCSESL